jgi:menaquinol-cytochrome c reductase iron-sulfur subunit
MTNQELSEDRRPQRRIFLKLLTALAGAAAAALVVIPGVGYLAGAVGWRKEEHDWISLGPVSSFPVKETRLKVIPLDENPLAEKWDGVSGKSAVYVRNLGRDQFQVFAINCTHLGCPVEWFPQSGLFMCPCHGGVYYEDGERASGPPPRGLYHCEWRVENEQLEIKAPFLPTLQHTLTGRNEA